MLFKKKKHHKLPLSLEYLRCVPPLLAIAKPALEISEDLQALMF